jgi:hypothetical protein
VPEFAPEGLTEVVAVGGDCSPAGSGIPDNSKAYWTAHKDVYETVVLSARKAIPAELAPEFGDGKVFRPNRDVRFSTGKSRTRRTSEPPSVPAIGTAG